ncbi:MAG: hypothetical protein ACPLVF_07585 [Thermovenabulum sp.]
MDGRISDIEKPLENGHFRTSEKPVKALFYAGGYRTIRGKKKPP